MTVYRRGDTTVGYAFSPGGAYNMTLPPVFGGIVPALNVEYVDAAGVRQSVDPLAEGAPTITGVAPLLMTIDATGTRAPTAFAAYGGSEAVYLPASYPATIDQEAAAEAAFALLACGHRINYGGGTGAGNWSYPEGSGASKNEDGGLPLWPAVFTEIGTHTVQVRSRDPLGNESTVSFAVVVTAPPSATHIAVSAGAWPTLASSTRYTMDADGDYRSFGALETSNLHNVIFEKIGSGVDPRIGTWSPDPRSKFGNVTMYPTRARHVRLVNIDMDFLSEGQRGYDYCGPIGGRVRRFTSGGQSNLFNEGTDAERSACRYTRGAFFVNCDVNNIGVDDGYVMIGGWNRLIILGCNVDAIDEGPTTWAVLRTYGTKHIYRHSKIRVSHDENAGCGLPLSMLCFNGLTETDWLDTDLPAPLGSAEPYGYRADHSYIYKCQMLDATSSRTNGAFTTGGNPAGLSIVRPNLLGAEDVVWYPSGDIAMSVQSYQLQGRGAFMRNVRRNMGAGTYVGYTTQNPNDVANPGNTNDDWDGPYFQEDANTRPVPSAF